MTAPREMTEDEVSARIQWTALHARIARERRMAAVSRAVALAWAITLAVALGIVLAKAPGRLRRDPSSGRGAAGMVKHRRLSQKHPAFCNRAGNVRWARKLALAETTATQDTGIPNFSAFRCPMEMEAMR